MKKVIYGLVLVCKLLVADDEDTSQKCNPSNCHEPSKLPSPPQPPKPTLPKPGEPGPGDECHPPQGK